MSAVLETRGLTVRFGGHTAVSAVSCVFQPGELTAIVGPNGAGKTTWFNMISGQIKPTSGQIIKAGRDITNLSPSSRARLGLGRAFQLTNLFPRLSVLENIRLAVQARLEMGLYMWRSVSAYSQLTHQAESYLERTGLQKLAHASAATLSHGDQRKLEVALLMAMEPDVYMFDEPTAGMSMDQAPEVLELIAELKQDTGKCILLVEHKMDVVRLLADRIVVLHNGELLAQGAPGEMMESALVQDVYLGKVSKSAA